MTRARDIADLVDANGDIVAGALDNVPAADLVNDTTPQLGGALDAQSNNITNVGNVGVGISSPNYKQQIVYGTSGGLAVASNAIPADNTTGLIANAKSNSSSDYAFKAGSLNDGYRLLVRADGAVTMPKQPLARASYSGGNVGATAILPLNSNTYTRGGMTVANNRITVPVTGAYFVGYHHLANQGGVQIRVKINGSGVAGSQTQEVDGSNTSFSAQQIISLVANDYLEFETFSGGAVHGNASYNCMYAYLLG